jgi:hypothetical protein
MSVGLFVHRLPGRMLQRKFNGPASLARSSEWLPGVSSISADPKSPNYKKYRTEEYEIQFADIFDQIAAYAHGTPINVVNPEVLEAVGKRA